MKPLLPTVSLALFHYLSIAAQAPIPPVDEAPQLLQQQPITIETWPMWRPRLAAWINDPSRATDSAYRAAWEMVRTAADAHGGQLPDPLAKDSLAWYFLGRTYENDLRPGPTLVTDAKRAEAAFRRSIFLEPKFARSHRALALTLAVQPGREAETRSAFDAARSIDPKLPLHSTQASAALLVENHAAAEDAFRAAMDEEPEHGRECATGAALAICMQRDRFGGHAQSVNDLCRRFPDDGTLVCFHGLALAIDGQPRAAFKEIQRARQLGADPSQVLPARLIQEIESEGGPSLWELFGWTMAGFTGTYAVIMALMALTGLVLAGRVRGAKSLEQLASADENLVSNGQVRRAQGEGFLGKLYGLALFLGLILFYVSIPFLIVGIIGGTLGLLWLVFQAGRIPIKLVAAIAIFGFVFVLAVVKSLFAKPGTGSFGLLKTAAEEPKLHEINHEVAAAVNTQPIDDLYLAPGSSIGVHQEGRGPFGMFGVKKRVLTLGLSTLRFLTIGELKAILAHEYAHFSHADTFINRFVYQVSLTAGTATSAMHTASWLDYVNPFYWFLVLYYKAYSLLSSGYSRSREFLADRMAAALYGPTAFCSGLKKVVTDGQLFEMTIYQNIEQMLDENKAFVNMYEAFQAFRDNHLVSAERTELYDKLLDEKASLFASHPTFGERVAALESFPPRPDPNPTPARQLLSNPDALEAELTEFLTGTIAYFRQMAAQAAAQPE